MLQSCHLKKGKEKNLEKMEKVPSKEKYLLQGYQVGYVDSSCW